jgi:hypothetical protein
MQNTKVKFKRWIPKEYKAGRVVPGTGTWENEYTQDGHFLQWGSSFIEFESGPANFTVGIIQLPDGSIAEIEPSRILFLNNQNK